MHWASALCGALPYVKGQSIPAIVGHLAAQMRLPASNHYVWIVDRGIISRPLLRALEAIGQFALGRLKANQVVYSIPRRPPQGAQESLWAKMPR